MDYIVRMKGLREDNDLTQREVAEYLKIDQRTYSRYETAKNALPNRLLVRLCDFYNVSADYMLGRSDKKEYSNTAADRRAGRAVKGRDEGA